MNKTKFAVDRVVTYYFGWYWASNFVMTFLTTQGLPGVHSVASWPNNLKRASIKDVPSRKGELVATMGTYGDAGEGSKLITTSPKQNFFN